MKKLNREEKKELIVRLLPAVITFGFNCFVYFSTKFLISPERFIFLDMEIDRLIPFVPPFVIVYYLSFAQWALLPADQLRLRCPAQPLLQR